MWIVCKAIHMNYQTLFLWKKNQNVSCCIYRNNPKNKDR